MKQDHRPWTLKDFKSGANTDADGAAIANADGVYRDARNMRLVDNAGNNGTLTKIGGEVPLYLPGANPGASTYHCIGSILVKGRTVEFWASEQPTIYAPLIRIDGVVMVQNAALPYVWNKDLQLHKMEDCEGGRVFDARSGGIPLHWDLGDIMAEYAAGNQTYFSGLDISAYQVNPLRPVNRPVFLGLDDIGAGSGMYPGQYIYSIRYVNANGDNTPEGPLLECVMVPLLDTWENNLPETGVVGANAAQLALRTKWGVHLKYRVNNLANMAYVEIMRRQFILDAGIDQVEDVVIAARIPIAPGQNTVEEFTDNGDTVAALSNDATLILTHYIVSANSVRYINYHLVYGGVELAAKNIHATYQGTDKTFPVTRSMGTRGHADAVNHCYKRRFQSGERYNVGAVFYLPDGSTSDVDFIEEVQLPNRRDPKAGDSLAWSDAPCYAATTDVQGPVKVGPTFEVFDHDNATSKQGNPGSTHEADQFVNVMQNGERLDSYNGALPNIATLPGQGPNTAEGIYTDTGGASGVVKTSWALPLRPVSTNDWKTGLDYKVNTHVRDDANGPYIPYSPKVFNVTHHSLALALRGVSQPAGVQGFSLLASKPAGRVVAQGLARWSLSDNGTDSTGYGPAIKGVYELDVSFPDYDGGMLSQADFDAIASGTASGGYQVQFVSPLGFASEQYGSAMMAGSGAPNRPWGFLSDMMSYARVLWDNGQINPGNAEGIHEPQPNGGDGFTGFGKWRNGGISDTPWGGGADGNVLVNVTGVQVITPGKLRLTMDRRIYGAGNPGSGYFSDQSTMDFHEPWYVVNIVRDGLHPDREGGYVSCNHYQAYVSDIGVVTGQNQQFRLADENLAMVQGQNTDGLERYIHIVSPQGGDQIYLNREAMTPAQYTQSLLSQAAQGWFPSPFTGTQVHGLYSLNGDMLTLDSFAIVGAKVEVRYDPRIPSVFHGDRVSAPSLAVLVDGTGVVNKPPPSGSNPYVWVGDDNGVIWALQAATQDINNKPYITSSGCLLTMGLGIPFRNYVYNPRYFVPFGVGTNLGLLPGQNVFVNQFSNATIHSVRQWIAMFDCEVRAPLQLSQYEHNVTRTFPHINYIPKPYNIDVSAGYGTANGFFPTNSGAASSMVDLYPDLPQIDKGGFFFRQVPLSPYRVQPRVRYYERPPLAGEEQTVFCDALVFSEAYSPLKKNSPELKTFPVNNIEFMENDTGGIQRLYSNRNGMFVLTESGAYHVLVQKNVAYSPDGVVQQMFAQDQFIGAVNPISKAIGMPGDWWRTAAEGSTLMGQSNREDTLFWYDGTSEFMLAGATIIDIAKGRYRKGLANAAFVPGTWTFPPRKCAAYDQDLDELLTGLHGGTPVYAASPQTNHWYGSYDYGYDKMLWTPGGMVGMRGLTTYRMNTGDMLNGKPITGWVKLAIAPYPNERMWYRRVKVDSVRKPARIEFYDENDVMVAWMDEATFGPHYLKKETAWEHWVPLDRVSIAPKKKAIQGRLAYAKVIFSDPGPDKMAMAGMLVVPVK